MEIEAIGAMPEISANGVASMESDIDIMQADQMISAKDLDGDHCLNIKESGFSDEMFSMMDQNGNFLISEQEFVDATNSLNHNISSLDQMMGTINEVPTPESIQALSQLNGSANATRENILG